MVEIAVRPDRVARVDDGDASTVSAYRWHFDGRYAKAYIYSRGFKGVLYMHRLLTGTERRTKTDHRDGDGLNNQRSNLRVCSQAENNLNTKKGRRGVSRFKGVYRSRGRSRWQAEICLRGQKRYLGSFETQEAAAAAYNDAARELFGDFARLNEVRK